MDHVLAMKQPCPLYKQAYDEYIRSDEIQSIFRANRTLIEYLEMHSGTSLSSIFEIKLLYDILWIENLKGFT